MAGVEDYRTPDEIAATEDDLCHVKSVLSRAVDDGAMLLAAIKLGEPQRVVELWTNRLWDGLRDNLDDEERLLAIVHLLSGWMQDGADRAVGRVSS